MGFIVGLIFDIISGSFLGLSALSYSVGGFVAGYFYNPEKEEKYFRRNFFLLIVLICSLVSSFIYFTIYFQGSPINFIDVIIIYIISTAVYTTLISIVFLIIYNWKFYDKD